MQSYSLIFGDEGVWRLVAYIRSIGRAETAPSKGMPGPARSSSGRREDAASATLWVRRGGHLGPDLTRVGRQRSLAYLRESVVAPSEGSHAGLRHPHGRDEDGKQITGVQRGYDNFSAQLMDHVGAILLLPALGGAIGEARIPFADAGRYGDMSAEANWTICGIPGWPARREVTQ